MTRVVKINGEKMEVRNLDEHIKSRIIAEVVEEIWAAAGKRARDIRTMLQKLKDEMESEPDEMGKHANEQAKEEEVYKAEELQKRKGTEKGPEEYQEEWVRRMRAKMKNIEDDIEDIEAEIKRGKKTRRNLRIMIR